jgi:SLOG cluster2
MTTNRRHRRAWKQGLIGFSISIEHDNLLRRGLGGEHLRELLVRLVRPILRQGRSLAYGGHWEESQDNLTYDFLRLISAEQEDSNGAADSASTANVGLLYNHCSWPNYLEVTPRIEAQWINACRIVRVTQEMAGFLPNEVVADAAAKDKDELRVRFNKAITLDVMRQLMMDPQGITLSIPDVTDTRELWVPPVLARIMLGGKLTSFSGFMPGIFEEALATMAAGMPTYVLGGFGGATEELANALLAQPGTPMPETLTLAWHRAGSPRLDALCAASEAFRFPDRALRPSAAFDLLQQRVANARTGLASVLNTGLDDNDTRELLQTRNTARAVELVRKGLGARHKWEIVPA